MGAYRYDRVRVELLRGQGSKLPWSLGRSKVKGTTTWQEVAYSRCEYTGTYDVQDRVPIVGMETVSLSVTKYGLGLVSPLKKGNKVRIRLQQQTYFVGYVDNVTRNRDAQNKTHNHFKYVWTARLLGQYAVLLSTPVDTTNFPQKESPLKRILRIVKVRQE